VTPADDPKQPDSDPNPNPSAPRRAAPASPWHPPAAIGAWLVPGLGHMLCGQVKRGVILLIAILALYTAGLLIGGIDVIDRREDRLWFYAQMGLGPTTWILDQYHQHLDRQLQQYIRETYQDTGQIDDRVPYVKSIGRANELGTLYCALAGMLNLLAVIDVAYRPARTRPERAAPDAPTGGVVTREAGS